MKDLQGHPQLSYRPALRSVRDVRPLRCSRERSGPAAGYRPARQALRWRMKKKTTPPSKARRKKAAPRARPPKGKPRPQKSRPSLGTLWDDDRAFRVLIKNSNDIFALVDAEGKILYRSPTVRRMIQVPDDKILRTDLQEWIAPEDRKEAQKHFAAVLRSPGKSLSFATRIRDEAGRVRWVEGVSTNYLADPSVGAILVNYRDVTDRIQQELVLLENERQYRLLFEHAVLAIFQSTFGGEVIRVNPAFAQMFGYASPEEVASSIQDIGTDLFADPKRRGEIVRQLGENPSLSRFENLYRRKDGSTFWGLLHVRTVTDTAGRPLHFEGFIEDISHRKQAEQALQESEQKASAIMASAPYGIAFVDSGGVITYANPAAEAILGLQKNEITRMTYDDPKWQIAAIDGGPMPPGDLPFARVMAERRAVYNVEHAILRRDGRRVLLSVNGAPMLRADGSISGMVATIRDITERKQSEEALLESEERYRSLFDSSIEGIGLSQGNRIVDVNKALLDIFGYADAEEFCSIPLLDHVAPESKAFIEQALRMSQEGGPRKRSFTYKIVRKDGAIRDLEISIGYVLIGSDRYALSTFRDITERKKAEEELRTLALRHEALLAAIPEIVMEVDDRKIYTWANPAGIEFFGEDVIGREAADYFEGEQETYTAVQPLFNGEEGTIYVESWQRRKDGEKRLLAWWCRPLVDSQGGVTGALSSARDITEQRRAEEQIQILSRFPTENPNPVMRIAPDGVLLYANNASRPFLDLWKTEVGRTVPEDCREIVEGVYASGSLREVKMICAEREYICTLTPIQKAGYVNVYGRDVTDREQARKAIERQAGELRQRNEELARLNRRSERQMRRLIAMRAIDIAITSSFKLELVLNILLGQLGDLLDAHAADILVFQPDLQTFRFVCGRGFANAVPQQTYLRKAESYANQAAQERRTIRILRLDERSDAAKIYPRISGEGFAFYLCLPLLAKGQVKGVLELFHRTDLPLEPEEESFLEMVAGQAAIAIDNAELFEGLQSTNDELTLAYNDTLTGWARTLELREREMAGEAQRLADLTVRLAQALGASENEKVLMHRGAILHDIGMMGIPDDILHKPGPLTEVEWTVVRKHPQFAYELLSPINYLRSALDIPYGHHEKWDGSGYPRGLKGGQIPFPARVFAVVDVWDALRSDRPQRKAWTDAEAREYIRAQSGTQFDPEVVQAFLEILPAP
jgi:PAS domain S-box-containing protein